MEQKELWKLEEAMIRTREYKSDAVQTYLERSMPSAVEPGAGIRVARQIGSRKYYRRGLL